MSNRVICQNCGIEQDESMYYFSRVQGQKRMEICKGCFENEVREDDTLKTFKKYNIPFISTVWNSSNNNLETYMKNISTPQYIHLRWKDSILRNDDLKEEQNFYDGIVRNLKNEAEKLNAKLKEIRTNEHVDMNLYISILKSLRSTLDLINEYDWKLMYSEYEIREGGFDKLQLSVWEQNHDSQIRNHKVWNVLRDTAIQTKESGNKIGDALKSISESIN